MSTARSWRPLVGGYLLLFACGGTARSGDEPPAFADGGAGGTGEVDVSAGEAPFAPVAGAPSVDPAAGPATAGASSSAAGAGGHGHAEAVDDGSGKSLCGADMDCPENLPCASAPGLAKQACVRACRGDDSCLSSQRCVSSPLVPAGCFPRCDWPWDCELGFDCVLPREGTEYVCVPAPWASSITGPQRESE